MSKKRGDVRELRDLGPQKSDQRRNHKRVKKVTWKDLEKYRFREPMMNHKDLLSLTSVFLTDISKKWSCLKNVKKRNPIEMRDLDLKRATAAEHTIESEIGTKNGRKTSIWGTHGGP